MRELSLKVREENLSQLASQHFDVLVIGGGVTGVGVALDAVSRGYSVALVEKNDFASGTSSKSTKLVHGGIRYLPNFDFALVHEALVERGLLLQNAPFLVKPIEFVLPMYQGDRHPVGMPFTTPKGVGLGLLLNIGLTIYDAMAGRRGVGWHRHLKREGVLKLAPALVQNGLKDGFTYFDAQTNDARLTVTLMRTAAQYGATVANHCGVTAFTKGDNGKINGAVVHDNIGDRAITVHARHVVNATGVYAEQLEELTGVKPQVSIEPSKGVHLILAREDLHLGNTAIVLPETEDKRILFVVPWGSRAIFGTTDTGTGDIDHPRITHEDVVYLLKYLNRYLSVNLSEKDIVSTYAGYRPLVKPRSNGTSTAKLSRSHSVLQGESGLVSIIGGKMTTYRRMAQDTVDLLSKRDQVKPVHPTLNLPLLGSAGWPHVQREIEQRGRRLDLKKEIIDHLGSSYGSGAHTILDYVEQNSANGQTLISDLPYIKAEILYACRNEMAMTPADVLSQRTSITLEDRQRGLGILNEVADIMSEELSWTFQTQNQLVNAYREEIEAQLATEKGYLPTH
jgi:glycerol-3-phosphate dehydrogenase